MRLKFSILFIILIFGIGCRFNRPAQEIVASSLYKLNQAESFSFKIEHYTNGNLIQQWSHSVLPFDLHVDNIPASTGTTIFNGDVNWNDTELNTLSGSFDLSISQPDQQITLKTDLYLTPNDKYYKIQVNHQEPELVSNLITKKWLNLDKSPNPLGNLKYFSDLKIISQTARAISQKQGSDYATSPLLITEQPIKRFSLLNEYSFPFKINSAIVQQFFDKTFNNTDDSNLWQEWLEQLPNWQGNITINRLSYYPKKIHLFYDINNDNITQRQDIIITFDNYNKFNKIKTPEGLTTN